MVRLELLSLNTMGALDPARLANTGRLRQLSSKELRELGRLPEPMIRRRGDVGFRPIGWNDALDLAASRLRVADPARVAARPRSRDHPGPDQRRAGLGTAREAGRRTDTDPRSLRRPGRRRGRLRSRSGRGDARPLGRGLGVRAASVGGDAIEQVDAAARGDVDVFWLVGGNFLETLPNEARSREALERPSLRIHQDIVVSSAILVDPSDTVLLRPVATRYEMPGGVTETSTERRIIFSPEVPGRRIAGARPDWEVLCETAARARPDSASQIRFASTAGIREEIARAIPLYRGIESLARQGDWIQWGGARLYADGRFGTSSGKARFAAVRLAGRPAREGLFRVSTRRGKQFNSMVQREIDPLTGAGRRDVFVSEEDARALSLSDGDAIRLVSESGEFRGTVFIAPIKPGNLEVHWPEGMALLSGEVVDWQSGEPDYNALVRLERG